MRQRDGSRAHESTTGRRPFLAATGVSVSALTGLAGCLGDSDSTPIADVDPLGEPIDSSGVSWDDLGDLEGEVTIYSGRTRDQIDPVFTALEDEYDGLTISQEWGDNDEQVNQILEAGDGTAADIFYSQDPGALNAIHEEGLLQELPSDVVDTVPESYREPDGHWTGVSGRVRSIMYNEDRLDETNFESWDELPTDIGSYATDDDFEGIISTRPNSGTFRGFIQAMTDIENEQTARDWVSDFMDQDPQRFGGGSDQAAAIENGGDDDPIIGLGNSYYAARLINEDPDSPINVTFTEGDAGALFSVAGIGVSNNVGDPELVAEVIRHLLAEEGQEFMMDANGEFPVVDGVDYIGELPGPDELDSPDYDLSEFDMDLADANQLLEDEGMMPL